MRDSSSLFSKVNSCTHLYLCSRFTSVRTDFHQLCRLLHVDFECTFFKEGWKGEVRNEASEFDPRDHYSTCSTNLTMKEVFLFVSPQTNSKNFELETLLRKGLDKIKVLLIGALHRLGWNNLFCCCMYDNVLNQNSDPHLTTCWFQDTNPGLQCQIQCFISRTTHSVLLPTVFLQYRNFLHWKKN